MKQLAYSFLFNIMLAIHILSDQNKAHLPLQLFGIIGGIISTLHYSNSTNLVLDPETIKEKAQLR